MQAVPRPGRLCVVCGLHHTLDNTEHPTTLIDRTVLFRRRKQPRKTDVCKNRSKSEAVVDEDGQFFKPTVYVKFLTELSKH